MKLFVAGFIALILCSGIDGLRLNITQLSNCVDVPMHYNEAQVSVTGVQYEMNPDNTCNILHGTYDVRKILGGGDKEIFISTYSCPRGTPSPCTQNEVVFKEDINCEKFHNDKSGPWYMYAPALGEDNKCINKIGSFEFNGAILKGQYLEKYMSLGEGLYRIKMLFHKLGEDMEVEHLGGCVELDFEIIE